MPNCRRRFTTEPEVKKHIDNHMNPHSSKSRRQATTNTESTKTTPFLTMDKQNNIMPRMGSVVKHELYFPQCYTAPFNQGFGQQTHSNNNSSSNNNHNSSNNSNNNNSNTTNAQSTTAAASVIADTTLATVTQ